MHTITRVHVYCVCFSAFISAPSLADTYACQSIDVPGSTWTQVWRLNDRGQVAAGSSLGAFLYDAASGSWLPLPAPPAASGFTAANLGALDVTNGGVVVGGAAPNDNLSEQGFILGSIADPSSYQFATYTDPAAPQNVRTEFRGANTAGLVTGFAYDASVGVLSGQAFIYNPTASAISLFSPGFTPFTPIMSDGSKSLLTIPGGINAVGQFVVSGKSATNPKEGILYDPATLTTYSLTIPGSRTSLRGINDLDPNSSANCTSANCVRIVGWAFYNGTSNLYSYFVDFDRANGFQAPQAIDCSAALPAGNTGMLLQGVNNSNVVTGSYLDAAGNPHGVIGYPNPVLPSQSVGGTFSFNVTVSASVPVFLDPDLAAGYRYASGRGDPNFASVTLPIGIGDNQYTLVAGSNAYAVMAGQHFDFAAHGFIGGVSRFEVLGIEPAAALATTNATAFVTQVTFGSSGKFTGSMTPLTVASELNELVQAADDTRAEDDAESAARAAAAGKTASACEALTRLQSDLVAGSSSIGAARVAVLAARGRAAQNALACP